MENEAVFLKRLGTISSAILLLISLGSCTKELYDPTLTEEFAIKANSSDATYTIKVALPDSYSTSGEKYAAIYVLDGRDIFDYVATSCKEISDNQGTKNALVVSISYGNNRSIDYTPTKVSSVTGGGPAFLNFIETQLIPAIQQKYNVDTRREGRVIIGHSYGGLFGAYAFCVNNALFGNYILLSPSLWFDNLVTLKLEKENRQNNKLTNQLVFLGIGESENYGKMQAPFELFYQSLHENMIDIKMTKNTVKNLDHLGSRSPNIIKGLKYYFQNR